MVRGGKLVRDDVWVRNGKILDPQKLFYVERRTADLEIDCEGMIVSPGFIDIQINGERFTTSAILSLNPSLCC